MLSKIEDKFMSKLCLQLAISELHDINKIISLTSFDKEGKFITVYDEVK